MWNITKLCDKTVDTYCSTIEYVPDGFNIQEMCDKAIHKCHFMFNSVPSKFKTQETCDKIVSDYPFKLKYCHDDIKLTKCKMKLLAIV